MGEQPWVVTFAEKTPGEPSGKIVHHYFTKGPLLTIVLSTVLVCLGRTQSFTYSNFDPKLLDEIFQFDKHIFQMGALTPTPQKINI